MSEVRDEDPRVLELREMRRQARLGGAAERIDRQHERGRLTARERLGLLLDAGTFNELEPFITHQGAGDTGPARAPQRCAVRVRRVACQQVPAMGAGRQPHGIRRSVV